MTGKYNDIIHLPHHVSKKHPQMSLIDRAAQFSPFAALTGYDGAIKETARVTDDRVELDQYMKEELSYKLQIIEEKLEDHPEISITYFQADSKKNGGTYVTSNSIVKKIDQYKGLLLMIDGTVIPIDEIISIDGVLLDHENQ